MSETTGKSVQTNSPEKTTRHALLIFLALLAGTATKLKFALTTIGTNDVATWSGFMRHIVEHGSVDIYKNIAHYNHPPLMSQMLALFNILQHHVYNGFPFLIRLPAILADIGSCILTYRIVKTCYDERSAFFAAIIVALSPILVFVSGFHGNTDPVFMFLILLAAYFYLKHEGVILPALILGLSLNIKIVPIMTVPAFFFFTTGWKNRALFTITLFSMLLAGYLYHAVMDFESLYRNVFAYSGQNAVWGIGQILNDQYGFESANNYSLPGKLLIFFLVTFSVIKLSNSHNNASKAGQNETNASESIERDRAFLFALSWTFLLFFVFTPGFGVQYLAWIVIPSVLLGLRGALVINTIGGLFLYMVYTFWSGGLPWYYADSIKMGHWYGVTRLYAHALWFTLVFWTMRILITSHHFKTLQRGA